MTLPHRKLLPYRWILWWALLADLFVVGFSLGFVDPRLRAEAEELLLRNKWELESGHAE